MKNSVMRSVPMNRTVLSEKNAARHAAKALPRFASVEEAVAKLRPEQPMYCYFPRALEANASLFLNAFPGKTFYALKANPDPYVLKVLHAAGVNHFDVASLAEVKLISDLFPDATMAFMHPVKSRESIRAAYDCYGVRTFVFDCAEELKKIRTETRAARDVTLVLRLAMPKGSAVVSLAGKFGAALEDAVPLLQEAKKHANRVGIAFHVGQQTLDPESYIHALHIVKDVTDKAGVTLDVLDVGGGFPVAGLGNDVRPVTDYFDAIRRGLADLDLPASCEVWGEPGRALCGTGASLVVRVELRKGDALYINDGSYGAFFDMTWMGLKNDMQLLAPTGQKVESGAMKAFHFYGPTCASEDHIKGPFLLPESANEGDFIRVDCMGGYASAMQTRFNGFYSDLRVEIAEPSVGKVLQLRSSNRKVGR